MADDILAQFEHPGRRTTLAAPAKSAEGLLEYLAFEVEDKLITVDIERATAPCRCPLFGRSIIVRRRPPPP